MLKTCSPFVGAVPLAMYTLVILDAILLNREEAYLNQGIYHNAAVTEKICRY